MKTKVLKLQSSPNVTLTTYLLDKSPEMPNVDARPAVLVFPGGGYMMCSDREAEPVAMAFLAQGYHAFVLRYSLGEAAAFPGPLRDAEEALELIRANARKWGVIPDKVAVCGFSAGGHLAAALGTMGKIRPNGMILGYPVIIKETVDILQSPVPALNDKVDGQTPPAFIFTTANDTLVTVRNALQFAAGLDGAGVPFEMHVFQDGSHGLSLAKAHTSSGFKFNLNPEVARWVELCAAWLEKLFGGFTVDREMSVVMTVKEANCYNVDLPLEVCWSNPACQQVILAYLPGLDQNPNFKLALSVSLRMMNDYSKVMDAETLQALDQKLNEIVYEGTEVVGA